MARLVAFFAGVVAFLLVPVALSGPTALLLLPAHAGLSALVCVGAALDGLAGRPARSRRWGVFYLVATTAMVAALEVGARVRGSALLYWAVPWLGALAWTWIPPLVAAGMGAVGDRRERWLVQRAVRARKEAARR